MRPSMESQSPAFSSGAGHALVLEHLQAAAVDHGRLARRLAVTAACEVEPPRAVRIPMTRVIMAMSSGTVSGRSSTMLSSGASASRRSICCMLMATRPE